MQKLVNRKRCISLILVAAYYFQTKRKEKERKAKHAKAGVEISNHELASHQYVVHIRVFQPIHSSCAVILHVLLQRFTADYCNVHILMLWIWSVHMQILRTEILNAYTYKAARRFTSLTKALRVSRMLQEVPIKHKYCTHSNALECHHAKILE